LVEKQNINQLTRRQILSENISTSFRKKINIFHLLPPPSPGVAACTEQGSSGAAVRRRVGEGEGG
jgi:hypothetical protein